jgi:hypothetical protein
MKTFVVITMICGLAIGLAITSWAGVNPGVEGETYYCAFPLTVVLDGNLDDAAWSIAPWHGDTIQRETLTSSADADITFAAVADMEWLYVAIKVTDDKIQMGENVGGDVWQDDSVEVYIDANHGATAAYDADDVQITIGADNIGGNVDNPKLGGTGGGPETGTKAAVAKTSTGWDVEAAVPLKNNKWDIKVVDGLTIGFNVHFNDDDDGGGRDSKLIWSKKDPDDTSWSSSAPYGDLIFAGPVTAVSTKGKVATAWGIIKSE